MLVANVGTLQFAPCSVDRNSRYLKLFLRMSNAIAFSVGRLTKDLASAWPDRRESADRFECADRDGARRRALQQRAAEGLVARWWILDQAERPAPCLAQRLLGAFEQPLPVHRVPHIYVDRGFVAERHVEHPVLELRTAHQQAHHAAVIEDHAARLARQAELVLDPFDQPFGIVLLRLRDE